MRIDWFIPRRLAHRLASNGVSNREVAYLMLGNLIFGTILFYGAFTWANPPWTLLSLIEFVTVAVVTFIGFTKCYDAAGGDANEDFAKHFNCLSFGVWIWTTVGVWSVYWAVVWLVRAGFVAALQADRLALATNLALIGGSYEWLWTFIAAVVWSVTYFAWLQKTLSTAAASDA